MSQPVKVGATLVKPVPPARHDSTHYDSFLTHKSASNPLSYATLPRNLSSSSNRRHNLNLLDADSSMIIQQMVAPPPAMPLISISPVGKTLSKQGSSSQVRGGGAGELNKPGLNTHEIMHGGTVNKHVFNDIDSMLCDLNRQLDEMLDFEKVIFRV